MNAFSEFLRAHLLGVEVPAAQNFSWSSQSIDPLLLVASGEDFWGEGGIGYMARSSWMSPFLSHISSLGSFNLIVVHVGNRLMLLGMLWP